MATVDEEDEQNFAEDECTMDFGEEEEASFSTGYPVSGAAGGPRFVEYPGEDFSQYLTESTDLPAVDYEDTPVESSAVRRRYVKNAKGTTDRNSRFQRSSTSPGSLSTSQKAADNAHTVPDDDVDQIAVSMSGYSGYESIMPAPPSPPSVPRQSGRETIRDRLGRFFSPGQSGRRSGTASKQLEPDRPAIHNFTFADSKIGMMVLAQREEEQATAAAAVEEDIPETQSDLGPGCQTWWDVGTLSSNRSLRLRQKADRRRQDKSNSTSDLAEGKSEDRRSLFGSISKAVGRARARRSTDTVFADIPKSPSSTSLPSLAVSDQETTEKDSPWQLMPKNSEHQTQGHATKSKPSEGQSPALRGSKLQNGDVQSHARSKNNENHNQGLGIWTKGSTDNQNRGSGVKVNNDQGQAQSVGTRSDESKSQGRYAKRGTFFKRLKDGVAPRGTGRAVQATKPTGASTNETQPASGLRFTHIYEEINRLTTDLHNPASENTFL